MMAAALRLDPELTFHFFPPVSPVTATEKFPSPEVFLNKQ
jgi:hypothetical protein